MLTGIPHGNTGNLRVAVASKDAGYQVEGVSVNMGERVIESLHGDENFDWQFTNEARGPRRRGIRQILCSGDCPRQLQRILSHSSPTIPSALPSRLLRQRKRKTPLPQKSPPPVWVRCCTLINEQFINTVSAVVLDVLNITDGYAGRKEILLWSISHLLLEKTSQDIDHFLLQ